MIQKIKDFLKWLLPEQVKIRMYWVTQYIFSTDFRKSSPKHIQYGEMNVDKTFYVIQDFKDEYMMGILSYCLASLPEVKWADKKNYIPFFDMQHNYAGLCQDEKYAYKENAWDYYFAQKYSTEEVFESRNVVMGWTNKRNPLRENWAYRDVNESDITRWNQIVRKYMDFQPEIKKKASEIWNYHVPKGKKVLGVEYRASFLRGEKLLNESEENSIFRGHPKQLTIQERILDIQQLLDIWNYDFIYIMSEDVMTIGQFKDFFGERCFYLDRRRRHFFLGDVMASTDALLSEQKRIPIKEQTIDYLTEVCLLTMCHSISACRASAGMFAQIYNGGDYEHVIICDRGKI